MGRKILEPGDCAKVERTDQFALTLCKSCIKDLTVDHAAELMQQR